MEAIISYILGLSNIFLFASRQAQSFSEAGNFPLFARLNVEFEGLDLERAERKLDRMFVGGKPLRGGLNEV